MTSPKDIWVVTPCHNEARRLDADAFRQYALRNPDVVFLFVDDGSTDDTARVLGGLVSEFPDRMRLIRLEKNQGKAEAVRRGLLEAANAGARIAGYWDADLAAPLTAVRQLAGPLEAPGTTAVLGSRVKLLGRRIERRAARHYLGRVFATCASLVLGLAVYDTQCGAKMFKNTPEFRQALARPFETGWVFDVELIARLDRALRRAGRPPFDRSAVEFPLFEWVDVPGSKVKPRHFASAALDLLRIARQRLRGG